MRKMFLALLALLLWPFGSPAWADPVYQSQAIACTHEEMMRGDTPHRYSLCDEKQDVNKRAVGATNKLSNTIWLVL